MRLRMMGRYAWVYGLFCLACYLSRIVCHLVGVQSDNVPQSSKDSYELPTIDPET